MFPRECTNPGSDWTRIKLATGKVPYGKLLDSGIFHMVPKGERPSKPRPFNAPGMTPAVWEIAKLCWRGKAKERPEVDTVLRRLENLADPGVFMKHVLFRNSK